MKQPDKKLVLEDGKEFPGYGYGSRRDAVCELVFNTNMVGYQEILSDPSYTGQIVVMTYPLIGNYGINDEDNETRKPSIGGMVVRECCETPSNFRFTKTFDEALQKQDIPCISGIDTRMVTRIIRNEGCQRAAIVDAATSLEDALRLIRETPVRTDAVSQVSCKERWFSRTAQHSYNVVAIDCGIKLNIVRSLNRKGCNVTVVPYNSTKEQILSFKPDGIFISNGPGDPGDVPEVADTIGQLHGMLPIFGICLGHQIIGRSYGASTYKLKFGHRGGNHPVKNLRTGRIEITSQNHNYAIDADSLKGTPLEVTHVNLLDNTVEGLECRRDRVFSVQYHPESAPGPQDSTYLFDQFIQLMEEHRNA
ncbi:MAG: glutamine-hydrolyzing carbamoyl-phosphate synthase small subunit [Bacteroidaceae bacterium]|nr:glutamine-hydrolyzing carbamoyl-phosphate synthase small subunit [Bacteroidaceae bacterium]